jgi:transposase
MKSARNRNKINAKWLIMSDKLTNCVRTMRRGPKYRHSEIMVIQLALIRLRSALPLRLLATIFCINHVTLWRYCRMVIETLSQRFDQNIVEAPIKCLIVDSTSTRVRTTADGWYSGYKKQRVAKVQVMCDETGRVHHVSQSYRGSVHDMTIWNREFDAVPYGVTVLADKAYAGGKGERAVLQRPIRRNEQKWKDDPVKAQTENAALSKQRIKIEHLFSKLKVWRIIHHDYPMKPETYATTFKAIAYLLNLGMEGK